MKNKLLLIEESIKDKVDSLNQKENFKVGYNFLIEQSNIDSAKKYLNNSKKIKYSNQLNQIINDYINNLNIINYNEIKDSLKINNWTSGKFERIQIDSILMDLSEISFWYLRNFEISKSYLELISTSDSLITNDKYIDLKKRLEFNIHTQKSQKFNDFYLNLNKMQDIYKDDLSKYNNLLNYLSQNLHYDADKDSLDLIKTEEMNMDNIKNSLPIMRDIQMGIPADIKININDDKSN